MGYVESKYTVLTWAHDILAVVLFNKYHLTIKFNFETLYGPFLPVVITMTRTICFLLFRPLDYTCAGNLALGGQILWIGKVSGDMLTALPSSPHRISKRHTKKKKKPDSFAHMKLSSSRLGSA